MRQDVIRGQFHEHCLTARRHIAIAKIGQDRRRLPTGLLHALTGRRAFLDPTTHAIDHLYRYLNDWSAGCDADAPPATATADAAGCHTDGRLLWLPLSPTMRSAPATPDAGSIQAE
jgi:hypothetical protein